MPSAEYDDTQLLPQNLNRRMTAGFRRNGRTPIDPLNEGEDTPQVPANSPFPPPPANSPPVGSAPPPMASGQVSSVPTGGMTTESGLVLPPVNPGSVQALQRAVSPADRRVNTVPAGTEVPGGTIQYTPLGGSPVTQMPLAPAPRPAGLPVSTGPGMYVDPMNPGAQVDLNLSQNLSDRTAMRTFPWSSPDALRGANSNAFEERTWQNTPLAPGLPTFQDIERMRGQGTLGYGPREQRQSMEDYVSLLTGQSGARTAAGQLDVNRGELGLRGMEALGVGTPGTPGYVPGRMGVAAGDLGIRQGAHEFAMNRQNQIAQSMQQFMLQNPHATQEERDQHFQDLHRYTPQFQPGGGAPGATGAGGTDANPLAPSTPQQTAQTNINRARDNVIAGTLGANPVNGRNTTVNPARAHEAITDFLGRVPLTPENLGYIHSVLIGANDRPGLVSREDFERWQRAPSSGHDSTENRLRMQWQQASRQSGGDLPPRSINPLWNPQASLPSNLFGLTPPGILANMIRITREQNDQRR